MEMDFFFSKFWVIINHLKMQDIVKNLQAKLLALKGALLPNVININCHCIYI